MGDLNKLNIKGIELFIKGDQITAEKLNQPREVLNGLKGVAPASQISEPRVVQMSVRQFKVKSVEIDHLNCVTWDTIKEGTDTIKVALPFKIRLSPFDQGQTFASNTQKSSAPIENLIGNTTFKYEYSKTTEREAIDITDEDNTEFQRIIPRFQTDDIIYAMFGITGGTDVKDQEDNVLKWQDMNLDGRFWAAATEDEEDE